MGRLTLKQEAFCQAYIETGNASEAYRKAYSPKNQKPESINRIAFRLANENVKIKSRIEALRKRIEKRHNLTVDDLLDELEEARQIALKAVTPQTSAAVAGTMGKAKLLGYDKTILAGDQDNPVRHKIEMVIVDPLDK